MTPFIKILKIYIFIENSNCTEVFHYVHTHSLNNEEYICQYDLNK